MSIGQPIISSFHVSALRSDQAVADESLNRAWTYLMSAAHPLNRVFSSPALFNHRCVTTPLEENRVIVIRDDDGRIVGVCPIVRWQINLPFQLRKRVLGKFEVTAATVLSGEPLLRGGPEVHGPLFETLLAKLPWCDCILFSSIPVDSETCRFLYGEGQASRSYLVHPRRLQPREWLSLELGSSLEEFLRSKQKRTRNTFKRRVRKLRDHGGGNSSAFEWKPRIRSTHSMRRPARLLSDPGSSRT